MAKTESNTGGGGAGARAVDPQAANEQARFEVSTPNPGFSGERFGIKFRDGKAYTDDPIRAHAMLELGYSYFDRKTKKRFPLSTEDAAKHGVADEDDGGAKNK